MTVLFWMSTSFQTTSRHLLISVLDRLCSEGHRVTVLMKKTDDEENLPEELDGRGIECIPVPVKASRKSNLAARYLRDVEYALKCRKYLKKQYDAVFVQSSNVAGFALKSLKKRQRTERITLNVQDIFPENAAYSGKLNTQSAVYKVFRKIQSYAYRNSGHVITISEDMKDTLIEAGCDPGKISVIYNWSYQDECFEGLDFTKTSHMFDAAYFNIVYAGNLGVMQNVGILIEAAKLMKDDRAFWFHIIGSGVYKEMLEKQAAEYGISNISFWPMQPSELAPLIYSAADVNVIPLIRDGYRTALPSKTATCFACGKPIVFAIGKDSKFGQRVRTETGCPVVEADSPEELVNAIREVRGGSVHVDTAGFFRDQCSITKNSGKYAAVITDTAEALST